MSLLEVKDISHSFGDKSLYRDASFSLYKGEHMGVVGQNGAGKSTLLLTLTGEVVPDTGSVRWQPKVRVGHLDQYAAVDESLSIFDYLRTAFVDLYEIEKKLKDIHNALSNSTDTVLLKTAANYQDTLESRGFYGIDSQVQRVAAGLGLTALNLDTPLGKLSGGQRAKVILAKLLLENDDVLLLDEPTNFLDAEHVEWFVKFLNSFAGAFIIVSHDFEFLDQVCNCICDVEFDTIKKYTGSYTSFLNQKEQRRTEYVRRFESQKKEIAKTEEYIAKNKVRASTAAMAKSRQKKLDKMDKLAAPSFTAKPNFRFLYQTASTQKALEVSDLEVGYYYSLLPKLTFTVKSGEKMVICGFNGIGKSTLLKTLVGEIPSLGGQFEFGERIVTGYYAQDFAWNDDTITPMDYILNHYPKMSVKEVRQALARVAIRAEHVTQPIGTLSGGEQSKVKLCKLTLHPCNFLILDEPTNHLDSDAQAVLQKAILAFQGTTILVSHDPAFYRDWADKVLNIEEHLYEANH